MKNLLYPLMLAAALITGVAIGYFAKPDKMAAASENNHLYTPKAIADVGKTREKLVVTQTVVITNSVVVTNNLAPFRGGGFRGGNPREWMENLKKSDPERYAQMTNRFAKWRARRQERLASKLEFLGSVDTSHMSAKGKANHDQLQELILRQEELDRQLHQEDLTEAQRGQLMQEMRELHHQMRQANATERQTLLGEMATNLGFGGDEVQAIVDTVGDIVEATEGGRGGPGGQPPPPGDAGAQPPPASVQP